MFKSIKNNIYKYLYENNRLLLNCIEAYRGKNYPIFLEYPVDPKPRWGHGKPPHKQLYELINANRDSYASFLNEICAHSRIFSEIPLKSNHDDSDPHWENTWFTGLSAASLFTFLSKYNPDNYIEIGSGYSTRFARKAVERMNLKTKITVIDPQPRVNIEGVADRHIKQPLEEIDLSILNELGANDILFIDSSHRTFMNSDVTIIMLDLLPTVKAGVIVHFHDIYLPYDYPPKWINNHWNEQYLLAALLLGNGIKSEILLPCFFVNCDPELRTIFPIDWINEEVENIDPNSFWIRRIE